MRVTRPVDTLTPQKLPKACFQTAEALLF